MANLNEYVLRLIFNYLNTPLDWVQVSEVCKLWKAAASKQWRTASNLKIDEEGKNDKNIPIISFKDAKRMVYCVAPFVQVLSGSTKSSRLEDLIVSFGPFRYKVKGRAVVLLELLAENASNIAEICFKCPPETKLLNRLIDDNKITKVTVAESDDFFEHIPTEKIEELSVIFKNPKYVKSFAEVFPNLKSLDLQLDFHPGRSYSTVMKEKLSLILPYVLGLTSFQLRISTHRQIVLMNVCSDMMKLSQLENLSLMFSRGNHVTLVDQFLNALPIGCPKLRAVKLANLNICERELSILLNLPNLESLDVSTVRTFRTLELLKPIKLSELRIEYYDNEILSVTNVGSALRMMPELKILQIERQISVIYFEEIRDPDRFPIGIRNPELIFEVVNVAASQEKDVVVKNAWKSNSKELRIANKNVPSNLEVETMTVMTPLSRRTDLLERVKQLVDKNLKSHYAVIEYE